MKILRKKKVSEITSRITANYIIAASVMSNNKLTKEELDDSAKHLADNLYKVIFSLTGTKGVEEVKKELGKYTNKHIK